MTSKELKEMEAEDEQLRGILQDHYFGQHDERRMLVRDQPALYIKAEEPRPDFFQAEYEPIVNYGVPRQLKESISNAILPLAVAVLFWALHMSGDSSTALSLSIGLPALGLAILGAAAPWVRR